MKNTLLLFRRLLPVLMLAAIVPVAVGCPGVIEIKSKKPAGSKVSTVAPILYDDFEKGLMGAYTYACVEGGAKVAVTQENDVVHSGKVALECTYQSGTGSYGGGFGWSTPYMPKVGYFDARGTLAIEMWVKAPRGATFQVAVKEGKMNGGDEEVYLAPQGTGTGSWKRYSFPWDGFTRSIYSGNQAGDDHFEIGSLAEVSMQLSEKQGDGNLYLDDIYFK